MKILITGAKGFVGRNLAHALKNIRDQKDRTHKGLYIEEIFECDVGNSSEELAGFCSHADFVFNFAGVNRTNDPSEFNQGNVGFVSLLLKTLEGCSNKCPVMLASSVQASLVGRYDNDYGKSKKAGEQLFFDYGKENGVNVFVYRFPNLFGKWCKPNYNSVIATFCHNTANDLPITVTDPSTELELLYIDDLVNEMIGLLQSRAHRCDYIQTDPIPSENGKYAYVPATHRVTLGRIAELMEEFKAQPYTLHMPFIPDGSFEKKLYSTYLSYLPKEKVAFPIQTKTDARGSFTELLKTVGGGQFSVNISEPGTTKGQHWHHTKWEFFIVVSGHALIQQRRIDNDEILEFEVSGDKIEAVHMLPGYTHNIKNLSNTEKLVTLMWANEEFDPEHPDTFFEEV